MAQDRARRTTVSGSGGSDRGRTLACPADRRRERAPRPRRQQADALTDVSERRDCRVPCPGTCCAEFPSGSRLIPRMQYKRVPERSIADCRIARSRAWEFSRMSAENDIPTTLTMQGYLPRVADRGISGALQRRGAALIEGCRGCGKTWAARHFARSEARLDSEALMLLAATDPAAVAPLRGSVARRLAAVQGVPKPHGRAGRPAGGDLHRHRLPPLRRRSGGADHGPGSVDGRADRDSPRCATLGRPCGVPGRAAFSAWSSRGPIVRRGRG